MAEATSALAVASRAAREAGEHAADLRAARDRLILEALAAGRGVREVAREARVEPIQVMRVRDRG